MSAEGECITLAMVLATAALIAGIVRMLAVERVNKWDPDSWAKRIEEKPLGPEPMLITGLPITLRRLWSQYGCREISKFYFRDLWFLKIVGGVLLILVMAVLLMVFLLLCLYSSEWFTCEQVQRWIKYALIADVALLIGYVVAGHASEARVRRATGD